MRLKPSVRILGIKPELVLGALIVESCYAHIGVDPVVTVGIEGTHRLGSEHYTGLALDFRMHHVPHDRREALVAAIREALGPDFDVLWESVGTEQEHVHVEFDPKAPY